MFFDACRTADKCFRSRSHHIRSQLAARVERRNSKRINSEVLKILELRRDAVQVSDAVRVGIVERARIVFIKHGGVPLERRIGCGFSHEFLGGDYLSCRLALVLTASVLLDSAILVDRL